MVGGGFGQGKVMVGELVGRVVSEGSYGVVRRGMELARG